ncbi:phosphate signaling complex PhoU family protein [Natronosalvus rutilus]|uniref:Phosphate uptake regulator PhoU n=1 Tax=Natronosalvus rutilus TaxID=2953753 RepID=A0A9E7NF98_9EURY|nr:phosphate uptake regulator PhoU [Natronosalvus rutilus]UTF55924.1 phosphate uptake regulator PhoU [Natronosalvus rutilus]
METRKIQMVGGGTYTVSLPKEWAESEDITAGDSVNLHTHIDGTLVLQARECEDDATRQIAVEVAHADAEPLERTLRAAYAVGAKEVRLDAADGFTTGQRRVIDLVARNLPGVSVTEESESKITVRTLLDTEEVSVRQSVRQLKFVALSMHRDATDVVTGDTPPGNLADRDDQADRLYAMIDRSFAQGLARLDVVDALELTRSELFELWGTTRELERVADHAEGIATVATEIDNSIGEPTTDELREISQRAREIITDAVSVIIGDADVETAQQALTARDQLREDITTFECRLAESSNVGAQLRPILDRLRRTAEHGGNIAEFGLRHGIRHGKRIEPSQETTDRHDPTQESHVSTGG